MFVIIKKTKVDIKSENEKSRAIGLGGAAG